MSWFSKNYEKAALGGAAVVALGLAYMGWSTFGSFEQDFGAGLKGQGNNNAAVRDADRRTAEGTGLAAGLPVGR